MKGTILFLIPGIVFGIVCSFFNKDFENLDVLEVEKKEEAKSEQKDDWSGLLNYVVLFLVVLFFLMEFPHS